MENEEIPEIRVVDLTTAVGTFEVYLVSDTDIKLHSPDAGLKVNGVLYRIRAEMQCVNDMWVPHSGFGIDWLSLKRMDGGKMSLNALCKVRDVLIEAVPHYMDAHKDYPLRGKRRKVQNQIRRCREWVERKRQEIAELEQQIVELERWETDNQ